MLDFALMAQAWRRPLCGFPSILTFRFFFCYNAPGEPFQQHLSCTIGILQPPLPSTSINSTQGDQHEPPPEYPVGPDKRFVVGRFG
jgi:hypothetical protein